MPAERHRPPDDPRASPGVAGWTQGEAVQMAQRVGGAALVAGHTRQRGGGGIIASSRSPVGWGDVVQRPRKARLCCEDSAKIRRAQVLNEKGHGEALVE